MRRNNSDKLSIISFFTKREGIKAMLITNKSRKKQIELFVDKDHAVMHKFYDITNKDIPSNQLLTAMRRLIKIDEDFYDPYLVIAEILFSQSKNKEAIEILQEAYERAVKAIADYKGRWPKEMPWGFLENRHLMRAIEEYALFCWEIKEIDEALEIFQRLLRANPDDNQGARFSILAIRLGLDIDEWQKPFEVSINGKVAGLDCIKVQNWFRENAQKFPDDFQWLINLHESKES